MDERGAVLPLTITVCFVFILILFHSIEIYMIDTLFVNEKLQAEQLESLVQMAALDIVSEEYKDHTSEGYLHYPNGTVDYKVLFMKEDSILKVYLTARTDQERKKTVVFWYHAEHHKLLNWYEK